MSAAEVHVTQPAGRVIGAVFLPTATVDTIPVSGEVCISCEHGDWHYPIFEPFGEREEDRRTLISLLAHHEYHYKCGCACDLLELHGGFREVPQ